MASKKEKAVKGLRKALKPLTGDALKRERTRKLIAKRKAIQKNVAAKKARDAAGMARAKKLASQGQAAAAKKKRKTPKKMRHPADPNMPSTAALDRGEVKGFPYREAGPKRERWVPKPKPKAAAAGGGKKPPNGNGKKAGAELNKLSKLKAAGNGKKAGAELNKLSKLKAAPKKKGPFSDAVMKRAAAKQKQIWSYYSDEPIPKDVLKDMAKPKAKKPKKK
jgi:hypothetical protein